MTEEESRTARVVITGIGAVSAWGWDASSLWRGLSSGASGIAGPRRFDSSGHRTRVVGEAPEVAPEVAAAYPGWRRFSQADRFAVVAATEASVEAGLDPESSDSERIGVYFGTSTAGMAEGEGYFRTLLGLREGRPRLRDLRSHQLNGPGDEVARQLRTSGPIQTLSAACASGALAIGAALDALRGGEIDAAVAGGADSLCHLTYAGFNALRAVDERPCRPFRGERAGLSIGEGGGALVLETLEHARRRGARPLAGLEGWGASCDAYHMTAPHPQGKGAALAIERALRDAGVGVDDVDFINAHGTGTPLNDKAEWAALEQVFGERARRIPVTSTKGGVGHLLGSSGAIEAVATVLCLQACEVHPTPGTGQVDETLGLDLVIDRPRPLSGPATAVSTSFAFGGANAALVLAARHGTAAADTARRRVERTAV
ncbi:MAG: beta-ketoacyl-[acyl-carrier-protein] synthase family protein [bacterium]|nr:beta-ketoacyl-[acyl-carrier-protein] synthase family protein [bacterium]